MEGSAMDETQDGSYEEHEPYGFMERELIFKLLASHALVDADFFEWLREDPESAAAELHIRLTDEDLDYLKNVVEWDRITEIAKPIRDSLHLDIVTNSW
jgi:hypothetical protein